MEAVPKAWKKSFHQAQKKMRDRLHSINPTMLSVLDLWHVSFKWESFSFQMVHYVVNFQIRALEFYRKTRKCAEFNAFEKEPKISKNVYIIVQLSAESKSFCWLCSKFRSIFCYGGRPLNLWVVFLQWTGALWWKYVTIVIFGCNGYKRIYSLLHQLVFKNSWL